MKLFLDDIRMPQDCLHYLKENIYIDPSWEIVRNYDEFVNFIENHFESIEIISFDHDLGRDHYKDAYSAEIPYDEYTEKTGYHCAKFLVEYCLDYDKKLPAFMCHSMNPVGKINILSLLENFKSHK